LPLRNKIAVLIILEVRDRCHLVALFSFPFREHFVQFLIGGNKQKWANFFVHANNDTLRFFEAVARKLAHCDRRTCNQTAVDVARSRMESGQVEAPRARLSWGRFQFKVYWWIVDYMLWTPVIGPLMKPY
uniref:Uncharacterized protein n=1 Tax=Parascaris equorum TaxID=6256 RepID=A0A914RS44_PAREQ